jgi:hypothetical protein
MKSNEIIMMVHEMSQVFHHCTAHTRISLCCDAKPTCCPDATALTVTQFCIYNSVVLLNYYHIFVSKSSVTTYSSSRSSSDKVALTQSVGSWN